MTAKLASGDGRAAVAGLADGHATGREGQGSEGPAPLPGADVVPPRWVPVTTTVICALAVVDAAYLTYGHFTTKALVACPTNGGFVDCGLVTASSYSHPFGIPVVIPGLAWSAVMLVLCSTWGWRAASRWVMRARLAGSVAGLAMVFYLLWAELIKLHHICEYCTVMHILTIALFIVIVLGTALGMPVELAGTEL
jgi:uncharacterized membrane protein